MAGLTVERLRHKLSPLENKEFTEKLTPLLCREQLTPFIREYRGVECVVLRPKDALELLHPGEDHTLRTLTIVGRSLQALLWERSYLRGELIFTKPITEVEEDGF